MFNNLSIDSIACKKEAHPLDDHPRDVLQRYQRFSLRFTSETPQQQPPRNGSTDHGRAIRSIADGNPRNLPVAGCHLTHGEQKLPESELLQAFLNSNSHGNGHTDHGVVACAQEAHHFHVKSACRRLFACGATAFGTGSPTFRKTRSTSLESGILCFPSTGTSYHINCSRNKMF